MNEFRQAMTDKLEQMNSEPCLKDGIFGEGFRHGRRETIREMVEYIDEWFDNYMGESCGE